MNFFKSLQNILFSSKNEPSNQENQNFIQCVQSQNTIHHANNFIANESIWAKFYMDNREYINPLKEELLNFSMKANGKITDIDITISDCKKTLELYEKLKDYCYRTQEGIIYFEYLWEPRNPNSHIVITKKRLQDLTENYAERKKYYERHQYAINHLRNDLITLISNHENILQKEVYTHFDVDLKDNISRMLYDMDRKGEIKRVKHGSTYQLSIK